jgi:hypothetical protein
MGDKKKAKKDGKRKSERKKAKQAEAPSSERLIGEVVEELRAAGTKLAEAANSPAGRQVIALGLSVAATAAQAALASDTRQKSKTRQPEKEGEPAAGKSEVGEEALAAMLRGVADAALSRILPRR